MRCLDMRVLISYSFKYGLKTTAELFKLKAIRKQNSVSL